MSENICPVCGKSPVDSCRCMRSESRCESGHRWHTCIPCGKIVAGHSDHRAPSDQHTCGIVKGVAASDKKETPMTDCENCVKLKARVAALSGRHDLDHSKFAECQICQLILDCMPPAPPDPYELLRLALASKNFEEDIELRDKVSAALAARGRGR